MDRRRKARKLNKVQPNHVKLSKIISLSHFSLIHAIPNEKIIAKKEGAPLMRFSRFWREMYRKDKWSHSKMKSQSKQRKGKNRIYSITSRRAKSFTDTVDPPIVLEARLKRPNNLTIRYKMPLRNANRLSKSTIQQFKLSMMQRVRNLEAREWQVMVSTQLEENSWPPLKLRKSQQISEPVEAPELLPRIFKVLAVQVSERASKLIELQIDIAT